MRYSISQLSNQRWGIFVENRLLATFGCHDQCLAVLKLLQDRMRLRMNSYQMSASALASKQVA